MVLGEGTPSDDPVQTVKDSYAQEGNKSGDEFLKPIIVGGDERRLKGTLSPRRPHGSSMVSLADITKTTTPFFSSTIDRVRHLATSGLYQSTGPR